MVMQGTVPSWPVTGKSHVALAHWDFSWVVGEVGGLECYTTWLELWVFLCFGVQREGPLLLSLHQCEKTFSYHRGLGKGHASPLTIAGGASRARVWNGQLLYLLEGWKVVWSPHCACRIFLMSSGWSVLEVPWGTFYPLGANIGGFITEMGELTDG